MKAEVKCHCGATWFAEAGEQFGCHCGRTLYVKDLGKEDLYVEVVAFPEYDEEDSVSIDRAYEERVSVSYEDAEWHVLEKIALKVLFHDPPYISVSTTGDRLVASCYVMELCEENQGDVFQRCGHAGLSDSVLMKHRDCVTIEVPMLKLIEEMAGPLCELESFKELEEPLRKILGKIEGTHCDHGDLVEDCKWHGKGAA